MTSCRHHSGYLADDEAGHTTYMARLPKKPRFPEMGQVSKLGHVPHPPSRYTPTDSSRLRSHGRSRRDPRPFGGFLDFLVEGQVLDSLQTVVEEATERMATMKTKAGVPLVEVQDPIVVPKGGRRARARPSLSTMHRHRVQPSLCTGRPNNYPSCSSSMSDSHSSLTAGWLGSHSQDSDRLARGMGSLPPMRDKLLLEKNLKRLLKLENRGKGLGHSCFRRDSLLWDSLGSQASSQWTQEPPLSWFSGLLGSSSGTPQTSELSPGEQELIFLKGEFNKEIKSLLSQPASFDLPGYCALREPHRTLDFLAEHHLFPALQSVVSQAVDKLSGARRHDGCPLFPSEWKPSAEPNSDSKPGSKAATLTDEEEPYDTLPTRASSTKMVNRKSTKGKGRAKPKEGGSPVSSAQVATRFRLEVTPTEEPKVPSPRPRQEDQTPPIPASGPLGFTRKFKPWRRLHLTLPAPGIVIEGPSRQTQATTQGAAPLTSPSPCFYHHVPCSHHLSPQYLALPCGNHLSRGQTDGEQKSRPGYCQSPSYKFTKKEPLPSISSKSTVSHVSNPLCQELINYLVEQVVSLLICKYKFEKNLSKQLGFISFPVTETLMDLFLGFKKVKGSDIRLSSKIDWSCLLHRLEETEWAPQLSRQASQPQPPAASQHSSASRRGSHRGAAHHGTAHQGAPQSSTESPSMQPEPSVHSELLDPQLLTVQEDAVVKEEEPKSQQEPKPSIFSGTDRASSLSQEVIDLKDSQGDEEEEEEDKDDDFFGDKPQSFPESQEETDVSSDSRDVGHGDPP